MKILYIHQYFRTPFEGGAIRSWYISTAMVKAGYEVEMITAHNQPDYSIKNIDGIKVHYLPISYENDYGFLKRFFAFILFANRATKIASSIKNVDLVYTTSTPLTVGLSALRLLKIKKWPFIFEVRDLWPEAPIQVGIIKQPLLKKLARSFEKKIYQKAKRIVALSPGSKEYIENILPGKEVTLIPNFSDCNFFHPEYEKKDFQIPAEIRNDDFIISYFGALGILNHLEYLLNAAQAALIQKIGVKFLIIGTGGQLKNLKRKAYEMNLSNVFFYDHVDKFKLKDYLSITDAAYISFGAHEILEHNSPNKFFDALASGKMVITNVKGWIKDLVEEHECGFYYYPEDVDSFIDQIKAYIENKKNLVIAQQNARKLAEDKFEKNEKIAELLSFLEKE